MKIKSKWAEEYVKQLQLTVEKPTYSYLVRLCHAHLNTFPFENISKLILYRDMKSLPSKEKFIENYKDYHFGGTCYTLNANFMELLKELGFDCYHVMLGEVHIGIIVVFDGEKYYVDCGSAAPVFTPIRIAEERENYVKFAEDEVYILPVNKNADHYKYVRYYEGIKRGNVWEFRADVEYKFEDFSEVIEKSMEPGSTFMSILRCQLWQLNKKRSVSLINNQFEIRYDDGQTEKVTLKTVSEIEGVLSEEFQLGKLPVRKAINVLQNLQIDIFHKKQAN
ncbi:arylamine N-acetyltransferase [Evansella halocellulosilytica]|uniref:arylamine N-acetyltransferase n=1 Tax=Evansella halocellulosilytica TaxID=2011013 RepID=UPI000BB8CFB4|nr:arylamine N-acetyltransferase [Evansella halocellulosilytica]